MSIPNGERLKLRVLQQLQRRRTYGPKTYRYISEAIGVKYNTVRYFAKQLMAEGRVDMAELKFEDAMEESNNEGLPISDEEGIAQGNISIRTIKDYVKKILTGRAPKNLVISSLYINYCKQNLNTKNLTLEDFETLGKLIETDVNLMTAENIKLGILGFIRVNKINLARRFYEDCSLSVLKHLKIALCTEEELNEIEEELDSYEQKLKVYTMLRQGYPVEAILEETSVPENVVRRMADSVEKQKQARQNKESEGIEH